MDLMQSRCTVMENNSSRALDNLNFAKPNFPPREEQILKRQPALIIILAYALSIKARTGYAAVGVENVKSVALSQSICTCSALYAVQFPHGGAAKQAGCRQCLG